MLHRTNVVLDEKIVQEAMEIGHIKTKRALIDTAIKEFIAKRRKNTLVDFLVELNGESPFYEGYDYKNMRGRDLPTIK
ncbi:hypothetical protein SPONN_236 [uncultured Candidatus Thioglobus sp.]|nr:hypothetical protein SPONL_1679 [uncultured Candidatus Thioglobus sp.]SMM99064.1 hypothetical protein SPONN_236 [uncultured Candidatus Thioglobus sp.]